MNVLTARVLNGRLVVDEPSDLPEGEVVELVPIDEVLMGGGDALDTEERAALQRELDASLEEEAAGQLIELADLDGGEAGLRAAVASLRAGRGRTLEEVAQTIAAILRERESPSR